MIIYRVDDRLIHGQVVENWLPTYNINTVVIVSEDVLNDEMKKNIMRFSTPQDVEIEYLKPEDLPDYKFNQEKNYLVLFPSLDEVMKVVDKGFKIEKLNLGGIHYAKGRNFTFGKAIFISDEECKILKYLKSKGVYIYAQTIPQEKERSLEEDI